MRCLVIYLPKRGVKILKEKNDDLLFNLIAPIYGLFYNMQKRMFSKVMKAAKTEIDLSSFETIIDVGCGTGALASVLRDEVGLRVTGVDSAEKMLKTARKNPENKGIKFVQANVLEKLPFNDNSFDIAISSYVAHGLKSEERKYMYAEMCRVARKYVIIHDYNNKRSLVTSIAEWFEGGNYFDFIKYAEDEMREYFSDLVVVNVDVKANWYIGNKKNTDYK